MIKSVVGVWYWLVHFRSRLRFSRAMARWSVSSHHLPYSCESIVTCRYGVLVCQVLFGRGDWGLQLEQSLVSAGPASMLVDLPRVGVFGWSVDGDRTP